MTCGCLSPIIPLAGGRPGGLLVVIPIGDDPRRRRFPFVMLLLLLANTLVFLYELSMGNAVDVWVQSVGLIPVEVLSGRDVPPPAPGPVGVTLFTSMFVHGGFIHFGSNMLYLWVFGDNVEDVLGHRRFLLFYFICGVTANLTHVFMNPGSVVPSVGASGAIAGVLGGYLVLFPRAQVRMLLFLGVFVTVTRISALLVIGFWFVSQLLSGLASLEVETYQASGVAVWAHIGGFIAGLVITILLRPRVFIGRRSA